jgi:hypothetical protein
MDKQRRTVVEIREDLHQEIRRIAILNDVKIYVFTNALVEAALKDQEKVKALVKRLKIQ